MFAKKQGWENDGDEYGLEHSRSGRFARIQGRIERAEV